MWNTTHGAWKLLKFKLICPFRSNQSTLIKAEKQKRISESWKFRFSWIRLRLQYFSWRSRLLCSILVALQFAPIDPQSRCFYSWSFRWGKSDLVGHSYWKTNTSLASFSVGRHGLKPVGWSVSTSHRDRPRRNALGRTVRSRPPFPFSINSTPGLSSQIRVPWEACLG